MNTFLSSRHLSGREGGDIGGDVRAARECSLSARLQGSHSTRSVLARNSFFFFLFFFFLFS
jgi:hypothetical protein